MVPLNAFIKSCYAPGHAPPKFGGGGGNGALHNGDLLAGVAGLPLQYHDHGPEPVTAVAVLLAPHKLDDGAVAVGTKWVMGLHVPLTIKAELQDAFVGLLIPLQVQV